MTATEKRQPDLGDRELDLMEVLWELGEGSVVDVQKRLQAGEIDLAYTTVQTMLNRLVDKGVVEREKEGRAYRYRATVRQPVVAGRSVRDLIRRFFDGSSEALARYLVRERLDSREMERLRSYLEEDES